jgi:O-antigen/teichoic acid export membrane protein
MKDKCSIIYKKLSKFLFLFLSKVSGQLLKFLLIIYVSSQLLNPEDFGAFSLYFVILNITYLIVGFGVLDTAMYVLNQSDDNEEKSRIIGSTLLLTVIISILFAVILMLILSVYEFQNFMLISLLSVGYVLQLYVKKICVPLLDYFSMYYFELILNLFILVLVIAFAKSLNDVLFIYTTCTLTVGAFFIIRFKPVFHNAVENIKIIIKTIKEYGYRVHLSQIIAMGTYDTDKFILQYIHGFTSVGIYNLALNIIMPVKLFSMSISELLFKNFRNQSNIPKRILVFNGLTSLLLSAALSIIGIFIIKEFYDPVYQIIIKYIYLLPVLAFLSSFYTPINYFFSAKGLSKQKLLNALVLAFSNILFNFIFVPLYGVVGAIVATIFALLINNLFFIYQYKKYINIEKV